MESEGQQMKHGGESGNILFTSHLVSDFEIQAQ